MTTPPSDPLIPELVSTAEAALILGISRQAVLLRATNGTLVGRKVADVWVFRRQTVEQAKTVDDLARVTLTAQEEIVLQLLKTHTQQQVADGLPISAARVSQIAASGRAKLAAMTADQRRKLNYDDPA